MPADLRLKQDVIEELGWEPSINAARIGVMVNDGVVTLTGHVSSYTEKWHVERAAQRVRGVRGVTIEIDVELPGSSKRDDADIARATDASLQWMTLLPADSVKVMVENGWITLSGSVDWEYQRKAAASEMRYLLGVRGISNYIALNPTITLAAIKSDIEKALKRRAQLDEKNISFEVVGSELTLTGTAKNLYECEFASHLAWATPGVKSVVNRIHVV